jgi:hypothetical protein
MVHVCDRFMEVVCGRDCLGYAIDSWSLLAIYEVSFDTFLHSSGVHYIPRVSTSPKMRYAIDSRSLFAVY